MQQVLPWRLFFFVLVDGRSLVAGSLVQSYGGQTGDFLRRRIHYCLLFLPVPLSETAMRRDCGRAKMAAWIETK